MTDKWGNNGNRERLYLGGSNITADGDYSREIKDTCSLEEEPGEHIKKQRHLLTKVHLVKPMIFPVVMNGCENCTKES